MEVDQWQVTPTELWLIIENHNTEASFRYGAEFTIEQRVAGIWRRVPIVNDNFAWTLVLYSIRYITLL